MTRLIDNPAIRATVAISCVLLLPCANSLALAQSFPQNSAQAAPQNVAPQLLGPDQLVTLVAPIALYPDPLLSQALAASTYPLEIVEAQQWLQQNRNLQGRWLIDAAKQQNWDPSVQLLVAFPDVMALFSRDIRWTTGLGNAFLAQQADVMNAIQTLRAQASLNGRLATTPQQIVTTETQNAQSAIQIQPADPQIIYPPVYDPAYVWGPSVARAYPAASYYQSSDYQGDYSSGYGGGSGFGNPINLVGLFSGLLGWGGWGWVLSWFTHTLSLNSLFFNGIFGSHNFGGGYNSGGYYASGGYGAPAVWSHNPAHRLGVPYSNGFVAARYHGADPGARFSSSRVAASGFAGSGGPGPDGWRHFGSGGPAFSPSSSAGWRGFPAGNRLAESYTRAGAPAYRSGFASNSGAAPQSDRGYSSGMPPRIASNFRSDPYFDRTPAPASNFAAPRSSSQQRFSMPRVSSPRSSSSSHFSSPRGSSHFSAPRHSGGGHSGGGHSGGGHSSKGSRKH